MKALPFLAALFPFALALLLALSLGCGSASDFVPKQDPSTATDTTVQDPTAGHDGKNGRDGKDGRDGVDGKPGVPVVGPAGKDGTDGHDGAAGKNGAQGDRGMAGQNAEPWVGDYWTDPDSEKRWVISSLSVTLANAICPGGMVLPPTTVPYKFLDNFLGLYSTLPTSAAYWSSIGGTIGQITRTLSSNGTVLADSPITERHMLICVEQ